MMRNKRLLWIVLSFVLILSAFALPMTASADRRSYRSEAWRSASTTIRVPWDARRPYQATVGNVRVVFRPGCLPEPSNGAKAYKFTLTLKETNSEFVADLDLEPPVDRFLKPVPVKFGTAKVVYYCGEAECAPGEGQAIPTRGGWVGLEHFSRYSGWY